MSEVVLNQTGLGNGLMQIMEATDIEPGSPVGYELCKKLYESHPLGGKIVEKPVRLALSKPRVIAMDCEPKDILVKAFEKEWENLDATSNIRDVTFLKRIYGAASIVLLTEGVPTTEPIDFWKLPDQHVTFNKLDPLNLAGSIVTNQNPNALDFQKPMDFVTAAGQPYHQSRAVTVFNGAPIYLSFQSSSFSFSGRSVFLRALYPMKSFLNSMVADDMVATKSGLLVTKLKPAGSIVNRMMQTAAGIKRSYLKGGATGNVLSIDIDEDITAVDLTNVNTAMTASRDNIIANIAASADIPALLLKDEALSNGFASGDQDAMAISQYIDGIRDEMRTLYEFFTKIVQHRAWNEDLFNAIKEEYPEEYGGMSYKQAFYMWQDAFSGDWESLVQEPESERIKTSQVKMQSIIEIARTLLPIADPQNKARIVEWVADNINDDREMFKSTLMIDPEELAAYEPPVPQDNEEKMPTASGKGI